MDHVVSAYRFPELVWITGQIIEFLILTFSRPSFIVVLVRKGSAGNYCVFLIYFRWLRLARKDVPPTIPIIVIDVLRADDGYNALPLGVPTFLNSLKERSYYSIVYSTNPHLELGVLRGFGREWSRARREGMFFADPDHQ